MFERDMGRFTMININKTQTMKYKHTSFQVMANWYFRQTTL